MKVKRLLVIFLGLWFFTVIIVQAETHRFSSSNERVNILELYTSEGCSSCPPAEKWLSQYQTDKRLWKEFIPVAFHVDYWNYIGWHDRFASPDFSKRQRKYRKSKNISAVYTPGVLFNGREWRAWIYQRPLVLDKTVSVGKLSIDLNLNEFTALFETDQKQKKLAHLNIAILGFDLISKVNAGENQGRELEHDFVVLGYQRMPMLQQGNNFSLSSVLPEIIEPATKKGLAVWIDYGDNLTPVQATGGWIEKTAK